MVTGLLADALAHGLYVRILAPHEDVPELDKLVEPLPFRSVVRPWALTGESQVAEDAARHDPGRAITNVDLRGCEKCSAEDLVLLRRAFSDCSEVEFKDLTDDHRTVFQAFAKLRASIAGPYLLPFFVKLEGYGRAERELKGYADATTHFVPFYARPNLDPTRCLMGATRGIIVGNFVEHAEPLTALVQRGTAQQAVNSLFEDALRGWRTQPYWNADAVEGAFPPGGAIKSFEAKRRKRADKYALQAKALGATLGADEIAQLLDGLPAIRYRQAFRHGDLHGDNVCVRSGQAILIDFLNVAPGPLVDDPAALDTALALAFRSKQEDWETIMAELYDLSNLENLPAVRAPTGHLCDLWNSVRQVRRFGLADQITRHEYARSVAVHLLRHATRVRRPGEHRNRRLLCILMAERLAKQLDHAQKPA